MEATQVLYCLAMVSLGLFSLWKHSMVFAAYRLYKQVLYEQKQVLGKVKCILHTMQRYQLNQASNLFIKEFQQVYGWVEDFRLLEHNEGTQRFTQLRQSLDDMTTSQLVKKRMLYFLKKYFYVATWRFHCKDKRKDVLQVQLQGALVSAHLVLQMAVLLSTLPNPSLGMFLAVAWLVALLSTAANLFFIRLCEKNDILAQFHRVMGAGELQQCFQAEDIREEQERNELVQMDEVVSPKVLEVLLFMSLVVLCTTLWTGVSLGSHPAPESSHTSILVMAIVLPLVDLVFRLLSCLLLFLLDLMIRHHLQSHKPCLKTFLVEQCLRLEQLDNVSEFVQTVSQWVQGSLDLTVLLVERTELQKQRHSDLKVRPIIQDYAFFEEATVYLESDFLSQSDRRSIDIHDNKHFSQQRTDNYLFLQELKHSLMMGSEQAQERHSLSQQALQDQNIIRRLDMDFIGQSSQSQQAMDNQSQQLTIDQDHVQIKIDDMGDSSFKLSVSKVDSKDQRLSAQTNLSQRLPQHSLPNQPLGLPRPQDNKVNRSLNFNDRSVKKKNSPQDQERDTQSLQGHIQKTLDPTQAQLQQLEYTVQSRGSIHSQRNTSHSIQQQDSQIHSSRQAQEVQRSSMHEGANTKRSSMQEGANTKRSSMQEGAHTKRSSMHEGANTKRSSMQEGANTKRSSINSNQDDSSHVQLLHNTQQQMNGEQGIQQAQYNQQEQAQNSKQYSQHSYAQKESHQGQYLEYAQLNSSNNGSKAQGQSQRTNQSNNKSLKSKGSKNKGEKGEKNEKSNNSHTIQDNSCNSSHKEKQVQNKQVIQSDQEGEDKDKSKEGEEQSNFVNEVQQESVQQDDHVNKIVTNQSSYASKQGLLGKQPNTKTIEQQNEINNKIIVIQKEEHKEDQVKKEGKRKGQQSLESEGWSESEVKEGEESYRNQVQYGLIKEKTLLESLDDFELSHETSRPVIHHRVVQNPLVISDLSLKELKENSSQDSSIDYRDPNHEMVQVKVPTRRRQ